MKRILVTGISSYIGNSFEQYIKENFSDEYIVDKISLKNEVWKEADFSKYDSIVHVAGLAHQKETKENAHLYQKINCDLTIELAKKAKAEGVPQFIFLSSMSVYGMDMGVITRDTQPQPKSNYGKSKWEAEQKIGMLSDENFCICILRPPMVYGKGCKGNFNAICSLVRILPFFPYVKNKRSMLYIDNLSAFVKLCVDETLSGLYFPQNKEYVSTVNLAMGAASAMDKKIYLDRISGMAVMVLILFYPTAQKAFGTLVYEIEETREYCVVGNEESIRRSV